MSFLDQLNARLEVKKQASMTALDRVSLAAAQQATMEYEVLKGLGKGSGRGRPKGSKNGVRQTGPNAVKPAASAAPAHEDLPAYDANKPDQESSGFGSSAKQVGDAFNYYGKDHFGGTNFTNNVIMHKDKAQAELHEGAMHSHLQDSGYQAKNVHNENGIISTEYEHPNGNKVLLNAGAAGSTRHFVGYHHSTPESRAADFGGKPKAKESDAPKAVPAAAVEPKTPKALPEAAKPRDPSAIGADGKVDEGKFKKGLKKIAEHTDNNFHAEAIAHGAKLLGRKDLADQAKDIAKAHMKAGHLTDELSSKRQKVYNDLQAHAKKVLSPDQAKAFYQSY